MSDPDQPVKPDPEKKPKRPRDANQLAKRIVDLATGQGDDDPSGNSSRMERGSEGGIARAKSMTPSERSEIARKAAQARWKKDRDQ